MTRGQVHVYTGDGKGKTTAAFGLAVRALCAGKNVYIGQFVKSMAYNETKIARLFDGTDSAWGRVRIERFGRGCFIGRQPEAVDAELAREGLRRCGEAARAPQTEAVLTGRYAPQELIAAADLVTEMREVKHYYAQGVLSCDGIDR